MTYVRDDVLKSTSDEEAGLQVEGVAEILSSSSSGLGVVVNVLQDAY